MGRAPSLVRRTKTESDNAVLRQFGERVRMLRGDRPQRSLLRFDAVAISRYESGRVDPSLTQLVRLAEDLGCTVEELLTGIRPLVP